MIWTGELNDPYGLGGSVGLYDTTLRDGEQTVGVVLDPEQKLEIARLLDDLGIDRIEAGFPRVSQDDWEAVRLISDAGLRAEIWGFSRAVPADLEALVELGVRASVIESPISDLKLEAIGVTREKMLGRITDAMRFAAEHGIHAAFFGVDSTRAEPAFYEQVYRSAVEAGAKEVAVVDTLGSLRPRRSPTSSAAPLRGSGPRARALPRPQRLRSRHRGCGRRREGGGALGARDDQRHGGAGGQREPWRGGAHFASAVWRRVEPPARAASRCLGARERVSGYTLEPWKPVTGRSSSGAKRRRRQPVPRSAPIEPYSSELVRRSGGSCWERRVGSTRSGSRPKSLDLTSPRTATRTCWRGQGVRNPKRGLVTDDEFRELARG